MKTATMIETIEYIVAVILTIGGAVWGTISFVVGQ